MLLQLPHCDEGPEVALDHNREGVGLKKWGQQGIAGCHDDHGAVGARGDRSHSQHVSRRIEEGGNE